MKYFGIEELHYRGHIWYRFHNLYNKTRRAWYWTKKEAIKEGEEHTELIIKLCENKE